MNETRRTGPVIPKTDNREFAYQSEPTYPGAYIQSRPSERGADRDEAKKYSEYEFFITKHTDTAMHVRLRKHRHDTVEQRKLKGAAVEYEDYVTIISFGELMNRIFGPGCDVYLQEEAFPAEIREAMKKAYKP